ncbi:MAG: antibiotic biosynthesis monooxygenase [Spirochaetales bacterium]|nr:antibiotic biosynthesis monooxygenase [Spirochaetales bacterium]
MHTAMMQYRFVPERLEEACSIWRREVLDVARGHEGFVRMQLYSQSNGEALAIGTWESHDHAEAFMRTGVFKTLLARLEGMTVDQPIPSRWVLRSFAEAR